MRVLIACEFSGMVRRAFRARGHEAWSCDLRPAADGSCHHYTCDVRRVLGYGWDLMIAHPDCTYLCSSGLHWNTRRPGRALKTAEALHFVAELWAAPIEKVVLENPQGCINTRLPHMPVPQYIQPYEFGEDASKKTGLWMRGLPRLLPTRRVAGRWVTCNGKRVERWSNQTDSGQNRLGPSEERWALRAATYPGIAAAFAAQWGCAPGHVKSVDTADAAG